MNSNLGNVFGIDVEIEYFECFKSSMLVKVHVVRSIMFDTCMVLVLGKSGFGGVRVLMFGGPRGKGRIHLNRKKLSRQKPKSERPTCFWRFVWGRRPAAAGVGF